LVLYNTFQAGVGYTDLSVPVPEVVVEEVSDQPKEAHDEVKSKNLQVTTNEKGALIVQEAESKVKEKKGRPTDTVPRVMDAKTATILGVLRQHFEEIPDYRSGFGVKITVRCKLSFLGEALLRLQAESEGVSDSPSEPGSWPAIYAVVLSFLTTGLYGPIPSVHVPFLLSEPPQRSSWHAPGTESPTSVIAEADQQFNRGKSKGKKKALPDQDSDDDRDHQILLLEGSKGDSSIVYSETILVELEPKQPVPTLVDAHIVFSNEDGHTVQGQLDSIPVGIEDLFQKPLLPEDLPLSDQPEYLFSLFKALFEACSGPGHLGGETFPLKNSESKPGVSIEGSESVKLLEGQADRIVGAVEQWLGPFVVAVSGSSLIAMIKDGGVLKHPVFLEEFSFHPGGEPGRSSYGWPGTVQLRLEDSTSNRGEQSSSDVNLQAMGAEGGSKGGLGCFFILIFLPPRYHLLLRMEVSDWSTLVRIRTDHWPCLAHVDEFLEALVMSR
jgi:AP-5 complex subunit beta-1